MSFWNIKEPFTQDKAVIGSMYFSATKSVTINAANVGLNPSGVKLVQAGLFLAEVGGAVRFLPRDVVQTAVTTSDSAIEITMPELFLPGDMVYHIEPNGLVTLSGTYAADDTVTLRFVEASLGINVTYVHTQVGADLAALDDEIVAALNMPTNPLYPYARFEVGGAGEILIFSKGLVFDVEVSNTGAGSSAVTNTISATPILIGTISNVANTTSTLNLTANSATALGVGARLGVLESNIYGLYNHSKDFTDVPYCDLKAIERADRVYKAALPYYDAQLDARFPNMIFE